MWIKGASVIISTDLHVSAFKLQPYMGARTRAGIGSSTYKWATYTGERKLERLRHIPHAGGRDVMRSGRGHNMRESNDDGMFRVCEREEEESLCGYDGLGREIDPFSCPAWPCDWAAD
jgi:hypothetical protein